MVKYPSLSYYVGNMMGRGLYMMNFIDSHFATIATLIGVFGGTIIGGVITSINQKSAENRKLERERNFKTLHIYNKFLEANGVTSIVGNFDNSIFQHELYTKKIRGILYEDLSFLHEDVYRLVREIDYALRENMRSSYDVKTHEHMYKLYMRLYITIEKHFYKKKLDL